MDVNGARALARRVGPTAPPPRSVAPGSVSEVALPVFQWFGIDQPGKGDYAHTSGSPDAMAGRSRGRFSLRRR